jgi:hypothetical protein
MGGDKGEGVTKNSHKTPPPLPSPIKGEGIYMNIVITIDEFL